MINKIKIAGLLILVGFFCLALAHLTQIVQKSNSYPLQLTDPKKADYPDMASYQDFHMTVDPALGRVPIERRYSSYKKTLEIIENCRNKSSSNNLEWIETGSNMGGRTRAIMWDPNDVTNSRMWAAGVTGGLWFNDNIYSSSSNWQAVDDFWPGLSISCLAYDPNNPMVFYAGTGEHQTARSIYRESSAVGIGIWKSTDGGQNWELLTSTNEFTYISDIIVRNEDAGSVIYAGVVSGIYQGGIFQSEPNDGLYRSINGGDSWLQVLPNIFGEDVPFAPADIEVSPNGKIFVGTLKNLDGNGGASILYSHWGTPGTWTIFDDYEEIIENDINLPVPDRVILACSPSDANIVYALIGAGWINSSNFNYAKGRYILRSDDGGTTWSERNLPDFNPDWANIAWHGMMASVNPNNPDEVYVGGKDVWRSTNGGNNWTKLSEWTLMYSGGGDIYIHCDQHKQMYANNSSDSLFISTDGGIFYTLDASYTEPVFFEKNNNYNTLQFYTCDIYPNTENNIFVGGLQDNGTLVYTGFPFDVNDMVDVGDGAYCFFDKNEPQIMITSTYYNDYSLFVDWSNEGELGMDGTGIFINPADYDDVNNILYANAIKFNNANANKILRCSGIPDDPLNELITLNTNIETWFSHVKVSPHSPEGVTTLYLGTGNGKIFRVVNAQNIPIATEIQTNELPEAYLSCLNFGQSEDTILATFTNFGVPSVWQTYNGGFSWQNIEGNLPDMPIRWGLYHPQDSKKVMVATEIGVWTTNDASLDNVLWEPETGMPNVRVDMVKIRPQDNLVLAATHGRGLIYTTWNLNSTTSIQQPSERIVNIFPNPTKDFIQVNLNTNESCFVRVYNQNGKCVFEGFIKKSIRIDMGEWPSGVYLLKCHSKHNKTEEKIIKL